MAFLGDVLLHLTLVLAVLSIESLFARLVTLVPHPTGRTMATASYLIARRVVLAAALLLTLWSVETYRTLRLARDTLPTALAVAFPGGGVAL